MSNSFTHSVNILSDIRMQRIIRTFGMEGVGIYWTIMEALCREEGKIDLDSISDLAFAMHLDEGFVRDLILNSGLFNSDEENFWSEEMIDDLNKSKEEAEQKARLRKRAKKAASQRWQKSQDISESATTNMLNGCSSNAQASNKHMLKQCSSIEQAYAKASKEKEEKEPPPLSPLSSPSNSPISPPYNPPSEKEEKEKNPPVYPLRAELAKKAGKQFITLTEASELIKTSVGKSEYADMLNTFVRNRRDIKKPMTKLALEQLIKLLSKKLDGDDERIDCISMSIANGWQGIFPDKFLRQRDGPNNVFNGFRQRTKTKIDYWSNEEVNDG